MSQDKKMTCHYPGSENIDSFECHGRCTECSDKLCKKDPQNKCPYEYGPCTKCQYWY